MATLSYLEVLALSGDCFMGGLMSVNELGLPTEFLYSEPIRPSKLQVSLYGTTLGKYLMVDVVGKGLVDASQARGVPVIVGHSELLNLATRVKRPLCRVVATSQRPLGEVGEIREKSQEEFAAQLDETHSPYLVNIYDRVNFAVDQHLPVLVDCAGRFDLLEPLERVKRSLEVVRHGDE